jgi:hypothetical protein
VTSTQYTTASIWAKELDYCSIGDILYWVEPVEDYIVSTSPRPRSSMLVAGIFVDQELVRKLLGGCTVAKAKEGYEGIFILTRGTGTV